MRKFKSKLLFTCSFVFIFSMIFIIQSCNQTVEYKPSSDLLEQYSYFTGFTDPGEYLHLYKNLPETTEGICNLIRKQLIHPFEAREMKDVLPEGRYMEG